MAVSRPLLFVLVGALALLAVVTGMRVLGGGQGDDGGARAPAAQTAATAADAASAKESPAASSTASARTRTAASAKRAASKAKDKSPQARALRALAKREVIILFFGQYHSADDRLTRNAVREVGREANVVVTVDLIENISKYPRLVSGLGIEQNPSTAVIDREGRAQVVEGFLDKGSLRQLVADARS